MAWLSGWLYRQAITVTASTGAGTGYQVEVDVTMAGLNSHVNNDFGDIRFTASDMTTQLVYLMKSSVSGVSANFLVKVTDDLSSVNATIYVYYGKVGATTTSSTNVYDFYDDASTDKRSSYTARAIYSGHTIALGWGGGFYGVISTNDDRYMYEIAGLGGPSGNQNYEIKFDYKWLAVTGLNVQSGIAARYKTPDGVYLGVRVSLPPGGAKILQTVIETNPPSTSESTLGSTVCAGYETAGVVYTFTGRIYGSSLYVASSVGIESQTVVDGTLTTGTYGLTSYINHGNQWFFTNVIVRHYVSPEPAVSFGAEQSAPPDPVTLSAPANNVTKIGVSPILSWNASTLASCYRLQIALDSGFTQIITDTYTVSTSYQFPYSLSFGETYYWQVDAGNIGGWSAWSSTWNFAIYELPEFVIESRTPTIVIQNNAIQ